MRKRGTEVPMFSISINVAEMKKRGQAWGFDLVVGMIIFIVGIISFYIYTINISGGGQEVTSQLQQEGELISDSLMSDGTPANWDQTNVVRIGLLFDGRINETKWQNFRSLVQGDYNRTKVLFRTSQEFFVYLDENFASGVGKDYSNARNLIKVTRVVVYNQSITTLNVYSWN